MQRGNLEQYHNVGWHELYCQRWLYETEIYKIPRNDFFFFSEIKSRMGLLLAQQITFLGHKKWLATDFWFTSFYCIYDVAVSNQW